MKNRKRNSKSNPRSATEPLNKALRIAREVGAFSEDEVEDVSPELLERCREAAERSYHLAKRRAEYQRALCLPGPFIERGAEEPIRSCAHLLKKSGLSLHEALIQAR